MILRGFVLERDHRPSLLYFVIVKLPVWETSSFFGLRFTTFDQVLK